MSRFHAFGDPNYHEDELLFFYIGQRMQDGLLPYVDIWDRKPPTLFLIYYVIAGISHSVLAYQIAAALFAAATAFVIVCISRIYASSWAGLLAGTLYLALLPLFAGGGGQPAIFLNLPMAIAVYLVASRLDRLRSGRIDAVMALAMLLAGIAITIKQTAVFEGVFLGCFILFQLLKSGMAPVRVLRVGAALALAGAMPMLAWAAFYAGQGHFPEFWHAMVTANLDKQYGSGGSMTDRAKMFALVLLPLALISLYSFTARSRDAKSARLRGFVAGWTLAAFIGFAIIPNLIDHYVLSFLVPLCVSCTPFLTRSIPGFAASAGLTALYLSMGPALDLERGQRSHREIAQLVAEMRKRDPAMRLLVYDGPVYLYALAGSHPPTPLAFPLHLYYLPEANVSHLDTVTEFRKLIDMKPTTVVMRFREHTPDLYLPETRTLVDEYVANNCPEQFDRTVHDMYGEITLRVFSGCGNSRSP